MRLRPGLNFNFTVLELNAMLQELFKYDPQHPEVFRLPRGVVPLCNNSALDRIRAMMPLYDSHGIDPSWLEPTDDVVQAFFDGLVEVPIRSDEQKGLTRDTTDEEIKRIATRLEEAAAAAAAGEFGFTVQEAEAAKAASLAEREDLAGEEEPAGHDAGPSGPAEDTSDSLEIGSSSSSSSGSLPQAEPPSPPSRRLRKAGDVAERRTSQPPPRRTTRSTAASSVAAEAPHAAAATGGGASRSTAPAPSKRPRGPTPQPPRAGGGPGFDFSTLSSDEEEEE